MNPPNAFERILASLHQAMLDGAHWPATAALIDEACGANGNALLVGQGYGDDFRVEFAQLLRHGESRQDLVREWFDIYYPHDKGMPRLPGLSAGRPVPVCRLYSENELKTSPAYNEGWRRLGAKNGLNVYFDEPDALRLVWTIGDPKGRRGWESAQLRLIEHLLPHVRQFVRVRQALAAAWRRWCWW